MLSKGKRPRKDLRSSRTFALAARRGGHSQARRLRYLRTSREDLGDYLAVDIRQATIDSVVTES